MVNPLLPAKAAMSLKLPLFVMTPLSVPSASTTPALVKPPTMAPVVTSLALLLTSVSPV